MKKFFLSLAAALLTLTASAQSFNAPSLKGFVEKQNVVTTKAKKAPAKADLAANQRYVGNVTTDDCAGGLGVGKFYTGTAKAAVQLTTTQLSEYVGAKVVGVRFYLWESTASGVFVNSISTNAITPVATKSQSATTKGWHTVMFDADQQFAIAANTSYLAGYEYAQTSTAYPVGVNTTDDPANLYIYANIPSSAGGSGEGWYNMGNDYCPCIQLIVESDNFPANAVAPEGLGTFRVVVGSSNTQNIQFKNYGSSLKNFDYTIKYNDTEIASKNYVLPTPMGVGGKTVLPIEFPAAAQSGKYNVTFTVTKVNGEENLAKTTSTTGKQLTMSESADKVVVIEEETGAACGWCPRGHVGMEKVRTQFGNKAIGIAIHIYSNADAMYNSTFNNYAGILKSGNAPLCVVDRKSGTIDPYYGSSNSIIDDVTEYLKVPAEIGINVKGEWSADKKSVAATATLDPHLSGNYNIAYALVADGLTGSTTTWKQANYYNSAYSSQTGLTLNQLPSDLKYLWTQPTKMEMVFNDVLIASSYQTTTNRAKLGALVDGTKAENTYTLTMPTNLTLLNAIDYSKVSLVAMVLDEDGAVVNAAKCAISGGETGIESVNGNSASATEVARYTIDGVKLSAPQKGLNIVKMSDGRTMKVMVK